MHFPERVDPRLARRGPQDVAAARLRNRTDAFRLTRMGHRPGLTTPAIRTAEPGRVGAPDSTPSPSPVPCPEAAGAAHQKLARCRAQIFRKNSLDNHFAIGYNAGLMDGAGSASRLTGPSARRRPAGQGARRRRKLPKGGFKPALPRAAGGARRDSVTRFAQPLAPQIACRQNVRRGHKCPKLRTY
jgi:hypothetical protein